MYFFSVEIFRDPHVSLGISIVGGQTVIKRLKNGEELKGIFIKQVLEDSPAGRTRALKTGDKILEVNADKPTFSFLEIKIDSSSFGRREGQNIATTS